MLKCAILADFLGFLKTVAATLTQLHAREEKHMGFLHFYLRTDTTLLVLKHHCRTLGWSWEKNYVKMCPFLPIF